MRHAFSATTVLVLTCCLWGRCLHAQTSRARSQATPPATTVRPVQVDILSLQVTKLPRNQFGQGIKPGANETVAFWLANSGTAVELRLKLDRPIARWDERASRLIGFADDKGGDLTRPPDGETVDQFFDNNKPILIKIGPKSDEAEVIVRGFRTPAPGGTKLRIDADLVFLAGTNERTAERKGLEPKPGTKVTIGPLRLTFREPKDAGAGFRPPSLGRCNQDVMLVMLDYERVDKLIKMVAWVNPQGKAVATSEGSSFAVGGGGTVMIGMPRMTHVDVRVVYYEKSGTITVPLRLETGLGF